MTNDELFETTTNLKKKKNNHNTIVDTYISSIEDSSKRSRVIIFVLIIASVLAFMSSWNSRTGNWTNQRINTIDNALKWINYTDSPQYSSSTTISINALNFLDELENPEIVVHKLPFFLSNKEYNIPKNLCINLTRELRLDSTYNVDRENLDKKTKSKIIDAIIYVSIRNITNIASIKQARERLISGYNEHSPWITIPFFNVPIHINDLGIFSGFTFFIILLLLRYSLSRELNNLKYVFKIANKENSLEDYYDLLSMKQVFTTPKRELSKKENKSDSDVSNKSEYREFWGYLPRILILLPSTTYLVVFINDLLSFHYGYSDSRSNTILVTIASLAFLMLIILMTYACFIVWGGIDQEWDKQSKTIIKSKIIL